MIQDRLTAKFQSAKPTQRRAVKTVQPKSSAAKAKAPATDRFTRGRTVSGSFWI